MPEPKPLKELFFDCYDAVEFGNPKYHDILAKVFYKAPTYSKVASRGTYFILGEKGSGKTMCAQYYAHIDQSVSSSIVDFSSIDFVRFEGLISAEVIKFTPLEGIWSILLSSIAVDHINKNETNVFTSGKFDHFRPLLEEIPVGAIKPEFPVAMEILSKMSIGAEIPAGFIEKINIALGKDSKESFSEIRLPLVDLGKSFEFYFNKLRVSKDNIIFIDGIDVKPDEFTQDRYITHLRAFVKAALNLNQIFAKAKGGGSLKFVILLRPDIMNHLGLQNQAAKVNDNSLILSWNSSSDNFKAFDLYDLSNKFLERQSEPISGASERAECLQKRCLGVLCSK